MLQMMLTRDRADHEDHAVDQVRAHDEEALA